MASRYCTLTWTFYYMLTRIAEILIPHSTTGIRGHRPHSSMAPQVQTEEVGPEVHTHLHALATGIAMAAARICTQTEVVR
jgi:hypothetical protein